MKRLTYVLGILVTCSNTGLYAGCNDGVGVMRQFSRSMHIKINTLSTKIDECCAALSAFDTVLVSDIEGLSTKIDGVSDQVSDINTQVVECCNNLSSFDVIIKNDLENVSSKVDNMSNQLTACCDSLSSFDSLIQDTTTSTSNKIDDLFSIVDTLATQSHVSACCEALSTLDMLLKSSIEAVSAKVDNINTQVGTINTQVAAVDTQLTECCNALSNLDEIIIDNIDSVSAQIDGVSTQVTNASTQITNVSSQITTCCNTLSTLDTILKSDIDSVSTKVDSVSTQLTSCCSTLAAQISALSGDTTFFGETVSEGRDDHLAEQFQYGIQSLRVTSATTGTGAVSTSNSMATVATGATLGSTASIQSKRYIRYQPGRQAYAIFSARFTTGISGTTQWMGCFDTSDGFAVGYNGTNFSLLYRNSVTGSAVNTTVTQTNFNVDTLNGSGSSGITLDPTKLNIFRISYSWLGAAPIVFDIMNASGQFITFHIIAQANSFTTPSLLLPQLPVRAEVANASAGSNVSIFTAGWSAGMIGTSRLPSNSRLFTVSTSSSATTTETHMLTIQNPTTFGGQTNKIEAKICIFGGGSTAATAQSSYMRLLKNATVTGTSFSAVNAGNSIMNVSTTGTYTASSGTLLLSNPTVTVGNGPYINYFDTRNNVIDVVILPGETITITAQGATASASPIIAVLGWDERF